MPNQPSRYVSSFIFRISGLSRISRFGFRIPPDLSGRIMQNEPNLPPRPPRLYETNPIPAYPASRCPLDYTKRTQFPHTQRPAAPYFCETNPISSPRVPHACYLVPQFHETNPIPARPTAKSCFYETNPISRPTLPFYSLLSPLSRAKARAAIANRGQICIIRRECCAV